MSEAVGFELKPQPDTSLSQMIDYGLSKHLERFYLVLREYSKFRIESNSYFSIRFDSKRVQLFEIFEYLPSLISYLKSSRKFLFNRTTSIFHLSNQPRLTTNKINVILAHYGPPSTETPTTETTTVRCHRNSWIYLTRLLKPMITMRFDSKRKKTLFAQH